MAFMAMRRNLDERARKKELDEVFNKFDRNKDGRFFFTVIKSKMLQNKLWLSSQLGLQICLRVVSLRFPISFSFKFHTGQPVRRELILVPYGGPIRQNELS